VWHRAHNIDIGLHNNIQFTMEKEEVHLPFLNIDVYRKTNGSLGHKVYHKPTHTNLNLHQNSHHHPAHKQSVLTSLLHRATARILSIKNWNFSPPFLRIMDTPLNRYEP
jgi:hypothetical protein